MTTSVAAARSNPRRTSTRALVVKIALLAVIASLGLAAAVSWEMTRGADPALRPKAVAAATQTIPARRVVKTVVIRRVVPSSSPGSSPSTTSGVSTPVAAATPAPVASGTS
jgi:hypothetical protein